MPKSYAIDEGDNEATIARKRKLQKSFKWKQRLRKEEEVATEKQSKWMQFQARGGAGKKKKQLHNFSKKTSMFKMPEAPGAKVGVIGSGKGMTNFGARKKHEYDDGSGQSRGAGSGADMRTGP